MRHMIAALMIALPATAQADFALSDLVGNWTGEGTYYEKPSRAKMKCRLSVTGDNSRITLSGRCGSSLGSETVTLDFVRQGGNRIVVQEAPGAPRNGSDIGELVGQIAGNTMVVGGQSDAESVKVQFEKSGNGTLRFITERVQGDITGQSVVTLTRR